MKKFFYASMFLLPVSAILAFTSTGPVLSLKEEKFDFGTIYQNDKCSHEFVFTNTGDEPLIITQATTTCGCDVPSYDREPVMPGKTGKLGYKYDSKRLGPINKSMTVTGNFEGGIKVLRIVGNIVQKPEPANVVTEKTPAP